MANKRARQMSMGVILSYVTIAVKMLTGILYTPIVLHTLGQNQHGIYSLCISFIGYLTILNAGVNAAYIRFYVQTKTADENKVSQLNGLFFKIFVVLSGVALLGGLILSSFAPSILGTKITPDEYELVRKCFALLAFSTSIEVFSCLFKSFITANEEFIFSKAIDIFGSILSPLLTLPLLLNGYDCTAILKVKLFTDILILCFEVFFCRRKLHIIFSFQKASIAIYKDIAQFIWFIALQSVMDQLNWQIDKFILARTQGSAEISLYSVGSTINTYFLLIGSAVSGVFIAEINRLVAKDDGVGLNALFRKTVKLSLCLCSFIALAYVVFGRQFVACWAGENYQKSYAVGWMLMTPVTIALAMGIGQDIARAKNMHQIQILINFGVCIVNLVVSIPLAKKWGAVGSALGTFISEIIICLIIQPIYYQKVLNLDIKAVFGDIFRFLPGLLPPIAFGLMLNKLSLIQNNYLSIIIYGIAFGIVYLASVLTLSMDKGERIVWLKRIKTVLKK